jgi:hypothetical protein
MSRRLAGAVTAPSGMPPASVRIDRFRPCLPLLFVGPSGPDRPGALPPGTQINFYHPNDARHFA